ncbi:hypothetical protein [Enterococcus wangshanyuanii]|uniref:Uncharacterized protein n=1 Tax=Enterococcus wangshanyuanii TaxID=2005703 RepID=A0ABQ1PII0_9ENTE|nr:hypothetical protein [Enterococcus wangshanyuanii]GGC97846.1 hypothetical protein GCM10011573_29230 [Enterococcus wangshanyuanii]
MHFDIVNALMFFFLTAGVISTGLIAYLFISDLFKKNKPVDNEPEYTEEEQFYASLLQQKSDLDADAFATRRAMMDEFLRHK